MMMRSTKPHSERIPLCRGAGALVLILLPLFFVLAGCSDSGNKKKEGPSAPPTVVNALGDRAVDFTIKTFDGGSFTLSEHAGSPVLINFWASWCGPCRVEGPMLQKLYEKYGPMGLVFVGVAIQDSEQGSREYLKEFGWTFPAGPDVGSRIMDAYNVRGIPKTVIIKRDGTVGYIQSGVMPEEYLAGKIEEILGE
jgi:cytochrome c biogenesis protein CcmG/thiol:disulfide interchange protein DsbE